MKIGLLGCKGTTLDLLHNLRMRGIVKVDTVISLPETAAKKNKVAFFCGPQLRDYCTKAGIHFTEVTSYALRTEEDLALFRAAELDLVMVLGWERLLPPAILGQIKKFACGMHGSAFGLPRGRGRSPMNWAILTGKTKFVTSLFCYEPGVDSGDIIDTAVFDINEFDTIETLHSKNRLAMTELIERSVVSIANGSLTLRPQASAGVTYYPQRKAEDGAIDWRMTSRQIYDLVRAVAPPYPGAFTHFHETRINVDWAQPFDSGLFVRSEPGTVLDVALAMGMIVVASGDGAVLITESSNTDLSSFKLGDRFRSVDSTKQRTDITTRYGPDIPLHEREI